MGNDGRIHQRCRGIGVFVAEKCADQTLAGRHQITEIARQVLLHFGEALLEQLLGLPMALGEILADALVLRLGLFVGQRKDIVDQLLCASPRGVLRLPAEMERAQHHPAWIGVQSQIMDAQGLGRKPGSFRH